MTDDSLLEYLIQEKKLLERKRDLSSKICIKMQVLDECSFTEEERKRRLEQLESLEEYENENNEELLRVRGRIRSYIHELFGWGGELCLHYLVY